MIKCQNKHSIYLKYCNKSWCTKFQTRHLDSNQELKINFIQEKQAINFNERSENQNKSENGNKMHGDKFRANCV